jgi:hypothetical protein
MANAVANNPIRCNFEDNDLRFEDVVLPQAKTFDSFWAVGGSDQILLHADRGGYRTIYWLHLESKANKEAAINYLFTNTAMEATFVLINKISLLYPHAKKEDEDMKGDVNPLAIRFGFADKEQALQFERYARPTFSDKPLKYSAPGTSKYHHLTLSLSEESDPIQRIKNVFAKINERFGCAITKQALKELGDKRFPPVADKPKENESQAYHWDHHRIFRVHRDRISEAISLPNGINQEWPTSVKDMNQWLTNPESFQGVYGIVVKSELASLFAKASIENDSEKINSLGAAIDSIPGFRKELLSDLKKQQAEMSDYSPA